MSYVQAKKQEERPDVWNFAAPAEQGKIVGFAGKCGAGKDSCSRFLYSLAFVHMLQITPEAYVDEETGRLIVLDKEGLKEFDEDSRDPEIISYLSDSCWPFIRKYSCAAPLKEFLHNVLGVSTSCLWGSQEQKQEPTHLKWEDMPVPVFDLTDGTVQVGGLVDKEFCDSGFWSEWCYNVRVDGGEKDKEIRGNPRTGSMSGRALMEYFGTDIIRRMYPSAWAKALGKMIVDYNAAYSIVSDVRFRDEVDELHRIGGKVIRLTRCSEEAKTNTHKSNTELDDFDGFDYILDNSNDRPMQETFSELLTVLTDWKWFEEVKS